MDDRHKDREGKGGETDEWTTDTKTERKRERKGEGGRDR